MDNKILFETLVKEGVLTEAITKRILEESAVSRRNPEELIYERRLGDEVAIAKVKSRLLGVPYKPIDQSQLSEELLRIIPEDAVRNYKVVPLSKSGELLVVGMWDPEDVKAQEVLKFIAKQMRVSLGVYLITYSDWGLVLRRYSSYQNEVDSALKSIHREGGSAGGGQKIIELEEGVTVGEEAPIIKIVATTLKEAVYQNASDIHIEPQRASVRVRFRLDGDLLRVSSLPIELHQPIISRIKVLANLKIDETRIPQDGRFRTVLLGRDIDFRVSTFPTAVGEKVAIRVLDPTVGLKGLEGLGLLDYNLQLIKAGLEKPYGMILMTGPTGSGKTTTLYSIMQILNKEDVNILSLEDPVEYFIEGLNQSQVRPEINYDFASGLRQILRQDPDVIMVGEIRDEETAGLAVHAALTGHIVLSTLHTNNALGVIPRLIDMKVDSFLLPLSLNLMLAQRLVSRLCDQCKKGEAAVPAVQEIIKKGLKDLPKEVLAKAGLTGKNLDGPFEVYHAAGCNACKGKGITGRVALFEVFQMTSELGEVISKDLSERKIFEEARRQGMVSLREDGIIKALLGLVSIEEVMKETSEV